MKLALVSLLVGSAAAFVVTPGITTTNNPVGAMGSHPSMAFKPLQMVASMDRNPPVQSNSFLSSSSPETLIQALLNGWLRDPSAHHAMEILLSRSTENWRHKIYDIVGAPVTADETAVAASLAHKMANPNNQFAILLGQAEDYEADFPSESVSYQEGKCWIELRLYNKQDGELMVVSGWELEQDAGDGSWLIDRIDWQDFRDAFYPGMGGREWARAF